MVISRFDDDDDDNIMIRNWHYMLQGEELEPARKKAEMMGIKQIYIDDLRETFVKDYVFPMFRCVQLQDK